MDNKSYKKDSGICSSIDISHGAESKVLSVRNLKALDDSFAPSLEVSMNNSDMAKHVMEQKETQVHRWLNMCHENQCVDQDISFDLNTGVVERSQNEHVVARAQKQDQCRDKAMTNRADGSPDLTPSRRKKMISRNVTPQRRNEEGTPGLTKQQYGDSELRKSVKHRTNENSSRGCSPYRVDERQSSASKHRNTQGTPTSSRNNDRYPRLHRTAESVPTWQGYGDREPGSEYTPQRNAERMPSNTVPIPQRKSDKQSTAYRDNECVSSPLSHSEREFTQQGIVNSVPSRQRDSGRQMSPPRATERVPMSQRIDPTYPSPHTATKRVPLSQRKDPKYTSPHTYNKRGFNRNHEIVPLLDTQDEVVLPQQRRERVSRGKSENRSQDVSLNNSNDHPLQPTRAHERDSRHRNSPLTYRSNERPRIVMSNGSNKKRVRSAERNRHSEQLRDETSMQDSHVNRSTPKKIAEDLRTSFQHAGFDRQINRLSPQGVNDRSVGCLTPSKVVNDFYQVEEAQSSSRVRHRSGHTVADTSCQTDESSQLFETHDNTPRKAVRKKISPHLSESLETQRLIRKGARIKRNPQRKSRDIGEIIRSVYSSPQHYRMVEESLQRSSSLGSMKRPAEDFDGVDTYDSFSGVSFTATPPKSRRTSYGSKVSGGQMVYMEDGQSDVHQIPENRHNVYKEEGIYDSTRKHHQDLNEYLDDDTRDSDKFPSGRTSVPRPVYQFEKGHRLSSQHFEQEESVHKPYQIMHESEVGENNRRELTGHRMRPIAPAAREIQQETYVIQNREAVFSHIDRYFDDENRQTQRGSRERYSPFRNHASPTYENEFSRDHSRMSDKENQEQIQGNKVMSAENTQMLVSYRGTDGKTGGEFLSPCGSMARLHIRSPKLYPRDRRNKASHNYSDNNSQMSYTDNVAETFSDRDIHRRNDPDVYKGSIEESYNDVREVPRRRNDSYESPRFVRHVDEDISFDSVGNDENHLPKEIRTSEKRNMNTAEEKRNTGERGQRLMKSRHILEKRFDNNHVNPIGNRLVKNKVGRNSERKNEGKYYEDQGNNIIVSKRHTYTDRENQCYGNEVRRENESNNSYDRTHSGRRENIRSNSYRDNSLSDRSIGIEQNDKYVDDRTVRQYRRESPRDLGRRTERSLEEDDLVCAKQVTNIDHSVAEVRKVKRSSPQVEKPRIKKNLFIGTRNVETPVSFSDFAEGISNVGEGRVMEDGQINQAVEKGQFDQFKVPVNRNRSPRPARGSGSSQMKVFQPIASFKQVMNSTAVNQNRRLSDVSGPRGNSYTHSTPMSAVPRSVPMLLNETISTIQAVDDTYN